MFQELNTMITDMLGPAGPLMVVAGLALLLILATIPMMLSSRPDPMDKLKQSGQEKMDAETRAILRDKKKILPSAAYLQGEYGIDGLFIGVPAKLGRGGLEEIVELELTDEEKSQLEHSAAAVRELVDSLS